MVPFLLFLRAHNVSRKALALALTWLWEQRKEGSTPPLTERDQYEVPRKTGPPSQGGKRSRAVREGGCSSSGLGAGELCFGQLLRVRRGFSWCSKDLTRWMYTILSSLFHHYSFFPRTIYFPPRLAIVYFVIGLVADYITRSLWYQTKKEFFLFFF